MPSPYLLSVVAYYRQAIEAGRWDDVLQEVELGLWRLDPRIQRASAETLRVAQELLAKVHDRIMTGAYHDALSDLDALRAYLDGFEPADERDTA